MNAFGKFSSLAGFALESGKAADFACRAADAGGVIERRVLPGHAIRAVPKALHLGDETKLAGEAASDGSGTGGRESPFGTRYAFVACIVEILSHVALLAGRGARLAVSSVRTPFALVGGSHGKVILGAVDYSRAVFAGPCACSSYGTNRVADPSGVFSRTSAIVTSVCIPKRRFPCRA